MDTSARIANLEVRDFCVAAVTALFPDICHKHLDEVAESFDYDVESVTNHIIDEVESGKPYPKHSLSGALKRKRNDDEEELGEPFADVKRKYGKETRRRKRRTSSEKAVITTLITEDFPYIPEQITVKTLRENSYHILPTYLAVQKVGWEAELLRKNRPGNASSSLRNVQGLKDHEGMITRSGNTISNELLEELKAAREVGAWTEKYERSKFEIKKMEEQELKTAKARGELVECQCCFSEYLSRTLVCCQSDSPHWFCVDCMRQYAESLVGSSKYEMSCLTTLDGCPASFSVAEKSKFLDKKLQLALDRIEADAAIRLASLDDLETCPFCPYAAEYPPVEENKEFRCDNPDCGTVSCRLCRKETHIPKTCEEAAEGRVMGARRVIEEAMSDALIRRCNKCQMPFIKQDGCNRMRCPQPGCGNYQCYVCGEPCNDSYNHFNKPGSKCKTWDNFEERHQREVREAEEAARKKVVDENPDIDRKHLVFKQSDNVAKDEENRKKNSSYAQLNRAMPGFVRNGAAMHRMVEQELLRRIPNGPRAEIPGEMVGGPAPVPPPVHPLHPAQAQDPRLEAIEGRMRQRLNQVAVNLPPQQPRPLVPQEKENLKPEMQPQPQPQIQPRAPRVAFRDPQLQNVDNARQQGGALARGFAEMEPIFMQRVQNIRENLVRIQAGLLGQLQPPVHPQWPQGGGIEHAARMQQNGVEGMQARNANRAEVFQRLQRLREYRANGRQPFENQHLAVQPIVQGRQPQQPLPNPPGPHQNNGVFAFPPFGQVADPLQTALLKNGLALGTKVNSNIAQMPGQQTQGKQNDRPSRNLRPLAHRQPAAQPIKIPQPKQQRCVAVPSGFQLAAHQLQHQQPLVHPSGLPFGLRYGHLAVANLPGPHGHGARQPLE